MEIKVGDVIKWEDTNGETHVGTVDDSDYECNDDSDINEIYVNEFHGRITREVSLFLTQIISINGINV